ncbi:MAG TPA: homoserine kinase [Nitrososphaera sp.]|jgi:homoserine kinase|nr:homoserine kinase [Nitrososphaera sp.]
MARMKRSVTAVAPCSTANLGPGYDVFGLALDALEDRVTIAKSEKAAARITISMGNDGDRIPLEPGSNSAGLVVRKMTRDHDITDPLAIRIKKGVPAGYGVGSSAASAAAAALALKALYDLKIDSDSLVEYAAEGEMASAGVKHYDNVSASLIGGFVISSIASGKRKFIRMEAPSDLSLVVAIPLSIKVPEKKTEVARSVLPKEVPLRDVVHNVSSASTIVAGFALRNVEMIARGVDDVIVEPARKSLIPGYDEVKRNALEAGALAVTISGAGPSMIAFLKSAKKSRIVAAAMKAGFAKVGIESEALACRPSSGAHLV